MPKWLKIGLIFIAILVLLWVVGRITGVLQFYRIPTPSSEPNVHVGQQIFTSNLKTPKRGDLIVYENALSDEINMRYETISQKHSRYLHRLCALEADVIQMKDGVFIVNGKDFDAELNLCHSYIVPADKAEELTEMETSAAPYPLPGSNDSFFIVNLSKKKVEEFSTKFLIKKYIDPHTDTSAYGVFAWYDKTMGWTADNFGPLTVPKGYCFVMGDNRSNSLDSRYVGFVKKADIKGVKL